MTPVAEITVADDVPPDAVVSRYFVRRSLRSGDWLFRQGTVGREVYFVIAGRLSAVLEVEGHRSSILRELRRGAVIGEIALYGEVPRSASIRAEEPCDLWELDRESLERMEAEEPSLAAWFHRRTARQLSERLAHTTREIREPLLVLNDFVRTLEASQFAAQDEAKAAILALSRQRKDEIGELAASFAQMEANLQRHIRELQETTAAKERIEREMELAGEIQASFLRTDFTRPPFDRHVDLHARLVPARQAAGDLFDFRFVGADHVVFAIGDVSDKGMPAALFMAVAITLLRASCVTVRPAAELMAQINRGLCSINSKEQFLSAFIGVLNTATGELRYANGGHPSPLLRGEDGSWVPLPRTRGVLLGTFADTRFAEASMVIGPAQSLFLYTDGVTEAFNREGVMFGEERLRAVLAAVPRGATAEELTAAVEREVAAFVDGAAQSDDITLLALRRA